MKPKPRKPHRIIIKHEKINSAKNGQSGEVSDLFFDSGFAADYAITIATDGSALFQLNSGGSNSLFFVKQLQLNRNVGAKQLEISSLDMSDLGDRAEGDLLCDFCVGEHKNRVG